MGHAATSHSAADHGRYEVDIVGESHYQGALARIVGGKTRDSAEHECMATLVLEDSNPFDSNAVRIDIEGQQVGYFPRADAKVYRGVLARAGTPRATLQVPALIVGGWKRGPKNEGSFGVKLDMRASMQEKIGNDARSDRIRHTERLAYVGAFVGALIWALIVWRMWPR
jgi:hypothetical protein